MTDEWQSLTHCFAISGYKGYVTVATDERGGSVLLEIRPAKAGGLERVGQEDPEPVPQVT